MTYQEIVDTIRAVALAVNSSGFFLNAIGGKKNAAEYYNEASPQIFLLAMRSRRDPKTAIRTWTATLTFLKQDQPDTTEAQREQIQADMDILSTQFFQYLFDNYDIDFTVDDSPENRILAGVYSGWSCNLTITTPDIC
jgi:hypothetical protein